MEKIKLICLPYAGGSATVYFKWRKLITETIQIEPVELAGRGKRFKQPFYNDVNEAVDDITKSVYENISNSPYAVFGHSMGSLLAYELVNKLVKLGCREPEHIFFSGRCPPHIVKNGAKLHLLPDEEFKECILGIGGTSKEIFESTELCNIFIPVLKADYKIVEEYVYTPDRDYRFSCPITALSGSDDEGTTFDEMLEWKKYTNNEFNCCQFNGGHFFIHSQMENVLELINKSLARN